MSVKTKIYNQKSEETGEIKLSDKIFKVEAKEELVHQAMVAQMSNERQVLAHTKDRSEVRGGGRKPWRQKGTGRARAGSNRSPIWIGGGVTFGPRSDRNFKKKINKKMKQKALFMVLSDRLENKKLAILDNLNFDKFSTKDFDKIIKRIEKRVLGVKKTKDKKTPKRSVLVINDKKDDKVVYSGRNLTGIKIINLDNINILDLLKYQNLIMTKAGVENFEKIYK